MCAATPVAVFTRAINMVRATEQALARPRGMPPGWAPAAAAAAWSRAHPPPFSPSALGRALDGDEHELRARLRAFLVARQPLFAPVYNAPLPRFRELALERLVAICRAGEGAAGPATVGGDGHFLSVRDFAAGRASRVLAAHEISGLADGSMATKMTVQFNLFGGTVARLGTAIHHDAGGAPGAGAFLDAIDSCREVGCFALTEAAYGNNAVEMETTATFVGGPGRQPGWVIHTPRPAAAKLWITNGACHAGWAVVFAQLETGGRREGVHAFLVRIRDESGRVLRGVSIEDMGVKMGTLAGGWFGGWRCGRGSFRSRLVRSAALALVGHVVCGRAACGLTRDVLVAPLMLLELLLWVCALLPCTVRHRR